MIVCAGNNESFSFAKPIGIGLVNSAINLTRLIIEKKPEKILFIGSAGSYGEAKIFDLILSNISTNIEIGHLQNLSYSPIIGTLRGIDTNVSHGTLHHPIVNSSNFITADKEQSDLFLNAGYSIENMEFFSILSVCREFNIPSLGLFCVTNFCEKNAHNAFVLNHSKAKEILANEVLTKYKDFIQ